MSRNQRIKDALRMAGVSQEKLAAKLGITQAAVGKQLNKDEDIDSVDFIKAVAGLTNQTFLWLLIGDVQTSEAPAVLQEIANEVAQVAENFEPYLGGKFVRPITVTVDRHGKELISYVPVKAQAGYMKGFGDPNFIEKLPAFNLPINISGTHRMFQVDGISMRQLGGGGLNDGDIVIAQYVEDIFSVKDNRVYVVVSTEGVIIKRCINRLTTIDKVLVCNSDNKSGEFGPIILHPQEILEVWELKAFISKQLSMATDLWDVINDLTYKQAMMADKLKELEQKKTK